MESIPNTPDDQSENNNWDIPNPSEEVNPSANEVEKHNEEYAQVLEKVIGEYENNREQCIQDTIEKAKEMAVLMDLLKSRMNYRNESSPYAYGDDPSFPITTNKFTVDPNTGEIHEDEEDTRMAQLEMISEAAKYKTETHQIETDLTKIVEAFDYKPSEEAKE